MSHCSYPTPYGRKDYCSPQPYHRVNGQKYQTLSEAHGHSRIGGSTRENFTNNTATTSQIVQMLLSGNQGAFAWGDAFCTDKINSYLAPPSSQGSAGSTLLNSILSNLNKVTGLTWSCPLWLGKSATSICVSPQLLLSYGNYLFMPIVSSNGDVIVVSFNATGTGAPPSYAFYANSSISTSVYNAVSSLFTTSGPNANWSGLIENIVNVPGSFSGMKVGLPSDVNGGVAGKPRPGASPVLNYMFDTNGNATQITQTD